MRYREPLDEVGQLLVLAVRGRRTERERRHLIRLYRRLGHRVVQEVAAQNQVEALVAQALVDALEGDPPPPDWDRLLRDNGARVEALVEALRAVVARIEAAGGAAAAVESGGVMLSTELPMAAFGSGDIDVLVDEGQWDDVLEAFRAEGFEARDRRERPTRRVEMVRVRESQPDQWLEVGYRPFDRMWVPLFYRDRSDRWLARREPSRKAAAIAVLNPADQLAWVAFHTSLHSYVRSPGLRLHVDVDRTVRDRQIDWDAAIAEVRAMGIPTRAFVSLSMAAGLLETPIPPGVLEELAPSRWIWESVRWLLASEGVVADGGPKLGRLKTVLLDLLVDERHPVAWAAGALWPNEAWLREHFDRDRSFEGPSWALQLRRLRAFATRWRPR